ncbi:MAG: hypothetical protein ACRDP4_11395 [Nocardioidaceae bacterium]
MTTVLEAPARRTTRVPRPPAVIIGVVVSWITLVLVVDAHATLLLQWGLGAATWGVLVALLARESVVVRVQTAVVVVFASIIELTFSPLLEVYIYRFHNLPMYVPPGHGLVYLAALAVGRLAWVQAHSRGCMAAVLVVGGGWSAYGVLLADRTDALGAFWFVCLAAFLLFGPSRGVYIGAFVVVSYLELLGTSLGTWTWQTHDPTGLVSIGNPPSGAPGGYGWFDLAALLLSPWIVGRLHRWRGARRRLTSAEAEVTPPRGQAADPAG